MIPEEQELRIQEIEAQNLIDFPDRPQTANIVTTIFALIFNLDDGGNGEAPILDGRRYVRSEPFMEDRFGIVAQENQAQSFTDIGIDDIIPSIMAFLEEEKSNYIIKHISELQSDAKLGSETKQQPIRYPHKNVVFHVAQLQAEAQSQEEPPAGSGIIYERGRLTTLTEASRVSGVKLGTLYNHLNSGKLTVRGRIIASAPGGGKVLIDLDELDSLPQRPVGRPKKSSKPLSSGRPRGRPRKNP